ncbi:hypothetical protein WJX72_001772 [[Myrmecia] bisecta]|uniref:Uncharacterized protein n=1 Tax=[Myrmecia] bisecta TaxID=41462 RepID=A0AAW1QE99_9CHLO
MLAVRDAGHGLILSRHQHPTALAQALPSGLLATAAQGDVLLARLLSLSSRLPKALLNEGSSSQYAPVLFDFRYFKEAEVYERRIEASPDHVALDEGFREEFGELVEEVFQLFEAIVEQHRRLVGCLEQLRGSSIAQATLETVMQSQEGRQVLVEALAQQAALLLLLDRCIEGGVRERCVVAYYRIRGGAHAVGPSFGDIMRLCSATGFKTSASKLPAGYPAAYVARLPLPSDVVMSAITNLRSADVYAQLDHFPNPEHRSFALSHQASCVYLLLFYVPQVLHKDPALMRVLVDKHFSDSWMVPWAPGFCADLAWEWDQYRAARAALAGVVAPGRVRDLAQMYKGLLPGLESQMSHYLVAGVLQEEYVVQHTSEVFNCLRDANVTLRWLLLHASTRHRKLHSVMADTAPSAPDILNLLLKTAQLEFEVQRVYSDILQHKEARWLAQRQAVEDGFRQLARFYAALRALPGSDVDANLVTWFGRLAEQVSTMECTDHASASTQVQQLLRVLEDAARFSPADASLQTEQYLTRIRSQLAQLVSLAAVHKGLLTTLGAVGDFGYAWRLIDAYTPQLQALVRSNPAAVGQLRFLFIKVRRVLDVPLLRISQANSPALAETAHHYSEALLAYCTNLLQVVPSAVFDHLERIAALQTGQMAEMASRVEKDSLRDYAQPEQRAQRARLGANVACLAQGITNMDRIFLGVLELAPTQLLQGGLRALLAKWLGAACKAALVFGPPPASLSFTKAPSSQGMSLAAVFGAGAAFDREFTGRHHLAARLAELARSTSGLRQTLESMQDLLHVPGLRLWQEELERVMSLSYEADAEQYMAAQAPSSQTAAARSGGEPSTSGSTSPSFLWRVQGAELLGVAAFRSLRATLGTPGLVTLDWLLASRIASGLQRLLGLLEGKGHKGGWRSPMQEVLAAWGPPTSCPANGPAAYAEAVEGHRRLLAPLLHVLPLIGQAQLLRRRIALELRSSARLDAAGLVSALPQYRYSRRLAMLERVAPKDTPDACALATGMDTLLQQYHPVYRTVWLQLVGQCVRTYLSETTGAVAQGIQAVGIDVMLPREVSMLMAFLEEMGRYGTMSRKQVHEFIPPLVADTWLSALAE